MSSIISGKYQIGERLGEGGMGVVHAGHHLALDTPIAIKLLQPEDANDASARSRFLREARRAASVQGEHCVRILDVGDGPEGPHIVMERLVGETTGDRLTREGPFSVVDATTILLQLLDAIAEAHGRGLVHRDLKPANIFLVNKPGVRIWVKVLDFGIAKAIGPDTSGEAKTLTELTAPHTLIGSPQYMSPEQMRGQAVDTRSDLWSCGVVLYELLSGKKPFSGGTLADLGAKILTSEPPPLGNTVPAPIARMIERCLRKDAAARPQNAYDVAVALAPFAAPESRALLPRIQTWCKAEAKVEPAPPRRTTIAGGVAIVIGAGVCAFLAASVRARSIGPGSAPAATLDPPVMARLDPPAPTASTVTPPATIAPEIGRAHV